MSWSRAAQSTCPVTTGTTVASHKAASASGPVSQPGWDARAAAQASSAAEPRRGAPQLGQGQVHQHLGRLPGPRRDHPGPDQPPAGFLQGVMAALRTGPGVLRAGLLP